MNSFLPVHSRGVGKLRPGLSDLLGVETGLEGRPLRCSTPACNTARRLCRARRGPGSRGRRGLGRGAPLPEPFPVSSLRRQGKTAANPAAPPAASCRAPRQAQAAGSQPLPPPPSPLWPPPPSPQPRCAPARPGVGARGEPRAPAAHVGLHMARPRPMARRGRTLATPLGAPPPHGSALSGGGHSGPAHAPLRPAAPSAWLRAVCACAPPAGVCLGWEVGRG